MNGEILGFKKTDESVEPIPSATAADDDRTPLSRWEQYPKGNIRWSLLISFSISCDDGDGDSGACPRSTTRLSSEIFRLDFVLFRSGTFLDLLLGGSSKLRGGWVDYIPGLRLLKRPNESFPMVPPHMLHYFYARLHCYYNIHGTMSNNLSGDSSLWLMLGS
jgi:hypothetical protein